MPPSATTETESSLQPENPHRRMHRVIYILTVVCLFAQVIEGSLIIPGVLLYWGFPQLGLSEICDEMYTQTTSCNKHRYVRVFFSY